MEEASSLIFETQSIDHVMGRIYPHGKELTAFVIDDMHMPFTADETGKYVSNMEMHQEEAYWKGHAMYSYRIKNLTHPEKETKFKLVVCPFRLHKDKHYFSHISDLLQGTLVMNNVRGMRYAAKDCKFALVGGSMYAAIQESGKDMTGEQAAALIIKTGSGYIIDTSRFQAIDKMVQEIRGKSWQELYRSYGLLRDHCTYCKDLPKSELTPA